jgi:hypothetical protein
MTRSDEASLGCGRGWTQFSDLGARSHISRSSSKGTDGSNPVPSSGESCTNLTSLSRASLMAAVASPPMCKVETNAEPLRSHWGQSRAAL